LQFPFFKLFIYLYFIHKTPSYKIKTEKYFTGRKFAVLFQLDCQQSVIKKNENIALKTCTFRLSFETYCIKQYKVK